VRRHPDWITYRRKALQVVKGTRTTEFGSTFSSPQVQRFIVGLIAEIITKYDVDGIQIDDHFACRLIWGMTPSQLGFTSGKMGRSVPPPKTRLGCAGEANKITLLMTKIFQAVKTVDKLSCDHCSQSQNFACKPLYRIGEPGCNKVWWRKSFYRCTGGFKNLHEKN